MVGNAGCFCGLLFLFCAITSFKLSTMEIALIGKRAVVCGSTQGIGKATAIELANLGASVTLIARNEQRLAQVQQELSTQFGQQHRYMAIDFTNPNYLKGKLEWFVSEHSGAHILINNTGGPAPGLAIDANPADFLTAFQEHLVCNQHLVQALVPFMKKEQYGRIINVISTSVKVPIPGLGVSNTIRGAVANWSKTLSKELGPYGITVNNVLPGLTKTQRLENLIVNRAKVAGISDEDQSQRMKENVPAQRFAEAWEVAAAIAFLAGPSAAYINGINLPVDGGNTPSL